MTFQQYWKSKTNSAHRESSESYYNKKAIEHGDIIDFSERQKPAIDIGCGAGELLQFLKTRITIGEAIDFSNAMLQEAAKRNPEIKFVEADFREYLEKCNFPVWIATGSINQYIDAQGQKEILDYFLNNTTSESLYLFDTIDPARYILRSGTRLLEYNSGEYFSRLRVLYGSLKMLFYTLFSFHSYDVMSLGIMGYAYSPGFWIRECKNRNLKIEIVSSKYYEYRYHIIVKK